MPRRSDFTSRASLAKIRCPACQKELYVINFTSHCWSKDTAHAAVLAAHFEDKIATWKAQLSAPETKPSEPTSEQIAREVIRAGTQGQPPNFGTISMTVGREVALDTILTMIRQSTRKETQHYLFISGDPGSGKSHLLNCARDMGGQAGFLIMQTQLLSERVWPADEGSFARSLFRGLRFPFLMAERGRRDVLVRLAIADAEAQVRKRARDVMGTSILSLDQFQFLMLNTLSASAVDNSLFSRSLAAWIERTVSGDNAEFDLSFSSLAQFERETIAFAANLGFKGCLYLVDELEAARDPKSYEAIQAIISRSTPGSVWILTGTRDLVADPERGILVLAPDLGELLAAGRVDLDPMTNDQLMELADLLQTAFGTTYRSVTERPLPAKEVQALANFAVENRQGVRFFIMKLVAAMQDRRLTS